MSFRFPLTIGTLTLVALLSSSTLATDAAPNIVFILTDDQGWSQMSTPMDQQNELSRSHYLETPSMAWLANEGMRFTSGCSPAPLCTPNKQGKIAGRKLHDLDDDLAETQDLAAEKVAFADSLQKQLLRQLEAVHAETRRNAGKKRK